MACLVAELASMDHMTDAVRRVDGMLGKLSYPVFLVHWSVAFAVTLLWEFARRRSLTLLAVSYPLVIACAVLLVRYLDEPVQLLRTTIRTRHDAQAAER
jgi:peptidoglycan/LPS O-acetylase OafA/YrhL